MSKKQESIFMLVLGIIILFFGVYLTLSNFESAPPFLQYLGLTTLKIGLIIALILTSLNIFFHRKEIMRKFKTKKQNKTFHVTLGENINELELKQCQKMKKCLNAC